MAYEVGMNVVLNNIGQDVFPELTGEYTILEVQESTRTESGPKYLLELKEFFNLGDGETLDNTVVVYHDEVV